MRVLISIERPPPHCRASDQSPSMEDRFENHREQTGRLDGRWLCTHPRTLFEKGPTIKLTGIDPRHKPHHLSLLPSGPDEVHDRLLRGGRPDGRSKLEIKPLSGNSAPHEADFGNRAPLAPRLAQPSVRIKHSNYFSSKKASCPISPQTECNCDNRYA